MEISISSDAAALARQFRNVPVAVGAAVTAAVATQGAVLQTKVKARASGRPGPRVQTGDYRRSISRQMSRSGAVIKVEVGTNSPQGRRLEFGFWGKRDSLGRLVHQPPYPHFGPAADEMEDAFPAAVDAAVAFALRLAR